MLDNNTLNYLKDVLKNMPTNWLNLTTHRLDIYNEELAKTSFLEEFERLFSENNTERSAFEGLPTAYDYIRLGHPLSCLLEWAVAKANHLKWDSVISFSSKTTPILAILRKNLFENKKTQICYSGTLPHFFDPEVVKNIYNYQFELKKVSDINEVNEFDGSTIFISETSTLLSIELSAKVDFFLSTYANLGSILLVNGEENNNYISEIQHVRRRETIAMTPINCHVALKQLLSEGVIDGNTLNDDSNKISVQNEIKNITGVNTKPLIGSSGLSIQYAIMMGLVNDAEEKHKGKSIKIIVPPNCYGGTNDQARRVAACIDNVEIVDFPVDGDNDMVESIDGILEKIAKENAVPYIIAEIPTNPRVEVPDLIKFRDVLNKERRTGDNQLAIDPVFILDQTFCPNVLFLGEDEILSTVRTIAYVSGSKFPSGGRCTAGYCVANEKCGDLMEKVELHLRLCDNEATSYQLEILAEQLPSMNQRISDAYKNTREFVNFIEQSLPEAKINFVTKELAEQGFTPSVFSLDLPSKGDSDVEREAYKRTLNLKLINLMITEIPNESKYCVSYGQLKGCYWTIPATSTQGTTKEGDKDYIARVALSADMDLERHKKVFADFVAGI